MNKINFILVSVFILNLSTDSCGATNIIQAPPVQRRLSPSEISQNLCDEIFKKEVNEPLNREYYQIFVKTPKEVIKHFEEKAKKNAKKTTVHKIRGEKGEIDTLETRKKHANEINDYIKGLTSAEEKDVVVVAMDKQFKLQPDEELKNVSKSTKIKRFRFIQINNKGVKSEEVKLFE